MTYNGFKTLKEALDAHKAWHAGETKAAKRLNLRRANLRGADLSGAHLIDANLTGANLTGANLSGAKLIPNPLMVKRGAE
jgi:uncharacterized protein YjbI with pentapeptide repeats